MNIKLTPQEEYELRYLIGEIYFIADILERKIIELNPIRNLNNTNSVIKFESVLKRVTDLSNHLDKGLNENSEKWGDCADEVEKIITDYLRGKEREELAKMNQNEN